MAEARVERRLAAILAAEGERQSNVLRAEGLAAGLDKILTVARTLDANTMQLQYLETLKQVGTSPATKIVVPMELGGFVDTLRGVFGPDSGRGAARPAAVPATSPARPASERSRRGAALPGAGAGRLPPPPADPRPSGRQVTDVGGNQAVGPDVGGVGEDDPEGGLWSLPDEGQAAHHEQ